MFPRKSICRLKCFMRFLTQQRLERKLQPTWRRQNHKSLLVSIVNILCIPHRYDGLQVPRKEMLYHSLHPQMQLREEFHLNDVLRETSGNDWDEIILQTRRIKCHREGLPVKTSGVRVMREVLESRYHSDSGTVAYLKDQYRKADADTNRVLQCTRTAVMNAKALHHVCDVERASLKINYIWNKDWQPEHSLLLELIYSSHYTPRFILSDAVERQCNREQ